MEAFVNRNGAPKIKSDRSHKTRQPKQKDSQHKSRAAPWNGNLLMGTHLGSGILIDTDHREKIISETAAALDFESFKSVLDYLPNELKSRIVNQQSL